MHAAAYCGETECLSALIQAGRLEIEFSIYYYSVFLRNLNEQGTAYIYSPTLIFRPENGRTWYKLLQN